MTTREKVYTTQLEDMGVYEPAFAPLIADLAEAERQRQRAYKEWRAEAKAKAEAEGRDPKKAKPDFGSPLWPVIDGLDKKILSYREAMGLTPKSLRRLRGQPVAAAGGDAPESISAKLDRMLEREDPDTAWSFEEMAQAVTTVGTGIETPSTAEAVSTSGNVAPRVSILPQDAACAAGGGKLNE